MFSLNLYVTTIRRSVVIFKYGNIWQYIFKSLLYLHSCVCYLQSVWFSKYIQCYITITKTRWLHFYINLFWQLFTPDLTTGPNNGLRGLCQPWVAMVYHNFTFYDYIPKATEDRIRLFQSGQKRSRDRKRQRQRQRERERTKKNLRDYVCHLRRHSWQKNSVSRDRIKREPMGLCRPFEAVICVCVHGFLAIYYMKYSCIAVATYKLIVWTCNLSYQPEL